MKLKILFSGTHRSGSDDTKKMEGNRDDTDLRSPEIRSALNDYDEIEKVKVTTNPYYDIDDTSIAEKEMRNDRENVKIIENPYYD